jgi:hypothetical protein
MHPPRHCLTERDAWLLDALARMRFLTSSQLLRLGFGASRSAVNKRVRRLFDAGLVRVWVRCLEIDNLYSLAPAGCAVHSIANNQNRVPVPRGLDRDLDHTLAINDVRIALATTLPALKAELVSWLSDWDLRPHRSRLVPDAHFIVQWPNGSESSFHLEVDRNTKSASALLRKLLAYRATTTYRYEYLFGSVDCVLVVAHNSAWLDRYRIHVAHAALNLQVWFVTLADVVAHGAAGRIWRSARCESTYTLPSLAALPNGSEGWLTKTAVSTCTSVPANARVPRPEPSRSEWWRA